MGFSSRSRLASLILPINLVPRHCVDGVRQILLNKGGHKFLPRGRGPWTWLRLRPFPPSFLQPIPVPASIEDRFGRDPPESAVLLARVSSSKFKVLRRHDFSCPKPGKQFAIACRILDLSAATCEAFLHPDRCKCGVSVY